MRLAAFIRANAKRIIGEWENFAKTLIPIGEHMGSLVLRDHIKEILVFVADDIESSQTAAEQTEKSHGEKPRVAKPTAAESHASVRHAGGFNMDQMVSEYRALRASVTKLWTAQLTGATDADISDLTRFNESIDQALTESIADYTKKLDHSRNLFLGILSHDLRNPLGAIMMSARLTKTIGSLNERQGMLASQIVESSERAMEIVSHLVDLTLARLGSGIPVVKDEMDMGFVAKQLVSEMRSIHPSRSFDLDITGETQGSWDKARIGQVFSNLLGNAVQYGFSGSPIGMKVAGMPNEIVISVHNHGFPIPRDAIWTIFDSLVRVESLDFESSSVTGNLGLGLFITKEVITAHGGTIGVTSTEKDGTTFTIRLPRSTSAPNSQTTHVA